MKQRWQNFRFHSANTFVDLMMWFAVRTPDKGFWLLFQVWALYGLRIMCKVLLELPYNKNGGK
jgi:hypothetical protein